MSRCPLHDDRAASLSVGFAGGAAGKVLVHCHAGCSQSALVAHFGLSSRKERPAGPRLAARSYEVELEAIMAERTCALGYRPPETSLERESAALRVLRQGGSVPAIEPKAPHEGDSRTEDPAWRPLFERRLVEVMLQRYPEWSGLDAIPTQGDIDEGRLRAARDLRELWLATRG